MVIAQTSEKFVLLSDDNLILHTDKNAGDLFVWCLEHFTHKMHFGGGIPFDDSALYADERGYYFTEKQLENQFRFDDDLTDAREIFEDDFTEYLKECCGKNGTLTRLEA